MFLQWYIVSVPTDTRCRLNSDWAIRPCTAVDRWAFFSNFRFERTEKLCIDAQGRLSALALTRGGGPLALPPPCQNRCTVYLKKGLPTSMNSTPPCKYTAVVVRVRLYDFLPQLELELIQSKRSCHGFKNKERHLPLEHRA